MYDFYTPVVLATAGSTSTPAWMGDPFNSLSAVLLQLQKVSVVL